MCLIVCAHGVNRQYPLVVVANRDEFFHRATAPLQWWPENPSILAGKDLQAGGTWMGVNSGQRWAAVTNYRQANAAVAPKSRGDLVRNFLSRQQSVANYVQTLAVTAEDYAGFNLLLAEGEHIYCFSNRAVTPLSSLVKGADLSSYILPKGLHGLSNHQLNTPWPKVRLAKQQLTQVLASAATCSAESLVQRLFAVLADKERVADELLPNTGVALAVERRLSPAFIVGDDYGTRSTMVLLRNAQGHLWVAEQQFFEGGKQGAAQVVQIPVRT